jgi:hypothetical protein
MAAIRQDEVQMALMTGLCLYLLCLYLLCLYLRSLVITRDVAARSSRQSR